MSDARRCDGPGCDHSDVAPFLGWWRLENAALEVMLGQTSERLDFCSWECLGAFVMAQSGTMRELEQRLRDE